MEPPSAEVVAAVAAAAEPCPSCHQNPQLDEGSTTTGQQATCTCNHDKMDPFEVRLRFSSHLQNLNASVTSAHKAAAFALKYKEMDEDLHSCILEHLEKVSELASGGSLTLG